MLDQVLYERLAALTRRLDDIEEHLARIGAAVGYQYTPPNAQEREIAEVRLLAQAGHMIEAIKLYRSLTGADLRQAKAFVETLR